MAIEDLVGGGPDGLNDEWANGDVGDEPERCMVKRDQAVAHRHAK